MPFEVKGYIPSIKPGAYQAVCTSVEETASRKDATNIFRVWSFALADGSQRSVEGTSSLSTSKKSKAGRWLTAMLGALPEEGTVAAPEGKACTIIVALKETTGYEYVEEVTAPQEGAPAAIITGVPAAAQDITTAQAAPTGDLPF